MSVLLLPLKLLLLALDFFIMLITFGWVGAVKKILSGNKLRSVPVADDETHRVLEAFKGKLATTAANGAATLYELSKGAFEDYAEKKALGTREYLGQHSPKVKKFGGVKYMSFGEVGFQANKFGSALRACGIVPAPETSTLDKLKNPCSVAIFENTCAEWMLAAQGAFTQSMIVTTIYATLGIDAVVDAINDGIVNAIVCNKRNVGLLLSKIKEMPTLKTIIYTSSMIAPDEAIDIPDAPRGVNIISLEDFIASGDTDKYPSTPPKPDTTAVIMYTSGSTGKAKGVVITHGNIVSCGASLDEYLKTYDDDVYIAYLPLAHIMELMAEFLFFSKGMTLCYSDPKTLTSKGSYPQGALEVFSPTLMVAVPKIWDSVKKGVEAKIAAASPVSQMLVSTAFAARGFALKHGYDTPLFKALVFKKFAAALGGKVRFALSGGGALNGEVQDFTRTCFGLTICQGYGLTETCAGLTLQRPDDLRSGIAGAPIASCEIKLESTPEILDRAGQPYLTADSKDHEGNEVFGRGEILVKGNNISLGYYMMEEKTKEEYGADGFFHTGDIGQFMSDGSIRIVDRKKNLVKLKGGEYIALENMEMVYGNSPFVDAANGGICCYGDADMDRPIAFMQLSEDFTKKYAKDNGIDGSFEDLKANKAIQDAVIADMIKEGKKGKLTHLEKLIAVSYMHTPWTPENGCLTAANKLQRNGVIQMYEKEFEETKPKGIF